MTDETHQPEATSSTPPLSPTNTAELPKKTTKSTTPETPSKSGDASQDDTKPALDLKDIGGYAHLASYPTFDADAFNTEAQKAQTETEQDMAMLRDSEDGRKALAELSPKVVRDPQAYLLRLRLVKLVIVGLMEIFAEVSEGGENAEMIYLIMLECSMEYESYERWSKPMLDCIKRLKGEDDAEEEASAPTPEC